MHFRYIPFYCPTLHFSPVERACAGCSGVGLVWRSGAAVLPPLLCFLFFFLLLCFLVVLYLFSLVACYALLLLLFSRSCSVLDNIPLWRTLRVSPIERACKV